MYQTAWEVLKETVQEWHNDNASRFSAALAYYTLFSLAPLLLIAVAVAGIVFGEQAARTQLEAQIQNLVGGQNVGIVHTLLEQASRPGSGILAGTISVIVLLWGASNVFSQLQDALNTMWDAPKSISQGIWGFFRARLLPFLLVLAIGVLLLASVAAAAMLEIAGKFLGSMLPIPAWVLQLVNFVVSFAIITVLFAIIYKALPNVTIAWREVWKGAAFTALLFTIGKTLLALYLGRSSTASSYGAAGSLMVFLVWLYWSAQIFFLGAEFTQVYARRHEKIRVSGGY